MQKISSDTSWIYIKRILRDYLLPRWRKIVVAVALMAIASGMTAAQAYLLEPIINKIFVNKMQEYLLPIGLSVIVVFVIRGFATWAHTVIMAYIGQDIVATIQSQVFHHLIRQDMAHFQRNTAGGLSSLLISDIMMMRMAMADTLTGFGKNILTLIFLVGVMFYQDWRFSIMALIVFPPAGYFVSKLGKRLREVARRTQEQQSVLSGLLNQSFMGIRQVKAYNAEEHEDNRIGGTLHAITKLSNKAARFSSISAPISELLAGAAIAIIVYYGGSQVIKGSSTPGQFFSFIGAFIMAYEPLKRLAKMSAGLQIGLAASARIFDTLDTQPTIVQKPTAQPLLIKQPDIVFDNVSFAYPDGHKALHNLSFHAPSGKKVALVGPSGSGKSTCFQLLLRFYDVQEGRILIDGQDIRDVTLDSLRRAIGFVSQDTFIFDDTVANNIKYGTPDASDEKIVHAAKQALANDFIMRLEDDYEARLGEMGTKLSGGQKQRIAIARAILKDAPILLLDEATSALDTESEKLVTEALDHLQTGRTTLVIAHRLSTIRNADKIVVFDHGRVIGEGSHTELMSRGGLYPSLYASMETA